MRRLISRQGVKLMKIAAIAVTTALIVIPIVTMAHGHGSHASSHGQRIRHFQLQISILLSQAPEWQVCSSANRTKEPLT